MTNCAGCRYPDMVHSFSCRVPGFYIIPKEESKMTNVVKRFKDLTLSKEDRLLRKYDLLKDNGDLTDYGKEAIWLSLLEEYKEDLVEQAQMLEAEDKDSKK